MFSIARGFLVCLPVDVIAPSTHLSLSLSLNSYLLLDKPVIRSQYSLLMYPQICPGPFFHTKHSALRKSSQTRHHRSTPRDNDALVIPPSFLALGLAVVAAIFLQCSSQCRSRRRLRPSLAQQPPSTQVCGHQHRASRCCHHRRGCGCFRQQGHDVLSVRADQARQELQPGGRQHTGCVRQDARDSGSPGPAHPLHFWGFSVCTLRSCPWWPIGRGCGSFPPREFI